MVPTSTGSTRIKKSTIAITISLSCLAAIIVGYCMTARMGMLSTICSTPFFVAATVLSAIALHERPSDNTGAVALILSLGLLFAAWLFAGSTLMAGLVIALDPSTAPSFGLLGLLNWG